jgi:hypothetical protein
MILISMKFSAEMITTAWDGGRVRSHDTDVKITSTVMFTMWAKNTYSIVIGFERQFAAFFIRAHDGPRPKSCAAGTCFESG